MHLEREVVVVALQRGLKRRGGRCGREAEVGQLRLHAGDGLGRRHGRARGGGGSGRGGGGGGRGRGGCRRGARAAAAGRLLAGALGVAPAPAADGHVAERAATGPVAAARLAE
uniref:Uncharacterized protein n=1 Tax=Zea mays TaxID=4577 RepID=A0A804LQS4_MAIZE